MSEPSRDRAAVETDDINDIGQGMCGKLPPLPLEFRNDRSQSSKNNLGIVKRNRRFCSAHSSAEIKICENG
ncbi:MAG TPA: hypothetical protein VEX69_07765, partial [Candidatus Limnocylindria bacterium]|nr:hypothetical protein [Candidatus Limnocylindria bacterium]